MKRLVLAALSMLSATALADPSGHKWFTLPVTYQLATSVDNTGATSIQGGVSYANALTAMRASFATWTKSQVSGTLWDSVEGAQFSSPSGRAAIDGNDGKNLVLFINGWTQGSQTLGVTWTSTFSSGQIVNADMELNNKDVAWFVGSAVGGRIDVQSVVTHEAGHFLGLDHTAFNVADAVMNPATAPGDIKRTLRLKDIQDVLGTTEYARLRVGIGKKFHPGGQVNYVLGKWTAEEKKVLPDILKAGAEAIKTFAAIGLKRTMDVVNATASQIKPDSPTSSKSK